MATAVSCPLLRRAPALRRGQWPCLVAALGALALAAPATALDGTVLRNDTSWYDTGDVVAVDMASGQARTVVGGGGCFGHCFSPDGSKIAFWRDGKIYTVNVDGSEVTEVCSTYSSGYNEQYLSWTLDGHIYWSERSPEIYRVDVATGARETVHTSSNGAIRLAKVSLDGRRAGCTRNEGAWKAWAIDLETHEEREIGDGCQATASPDGTLLTHNIPGHQIARIHRFSDLSEYRVIHKPAERTEFDMHEFSHSSNSHVVYTSDYDYAYVHDIETDTPYFAGRGAPFDFRPDLELPVLGLSPQQLSFVATVGGADPASQSVGVLNLGGGTLDPVTWAVDAGWLSVAAVGSGNQQGLDNAVSIAGLAAARYQTTVTVTCANAQDSPQSYQVELDLRSGTTNQPPAVSAGGDFTVALGAPAQLDGTVTDDGLPDGTLTVAWSQVSGPGAAVFQDAAAADTAVTLPQLGDYELRLSADDGELSASDTLTVHVVQQAPPSITILSPAGGEVWQVGSTQEIRWTTENLSDVAIRYSIDGGATMAGLIDDNVDTGDPEWGAFPWTVPDTPSDSCLIMIAGYFGEAPTRSAVFEIRAAPPAQEDGGAGHDSGAGREQGAVASGCSCGAAASTGGLAMLWVLLAALRRRRTRGL